jgi:hypothetical protein
VASRRFDESWTREVAASLTLTAPTTRRELPLTSIGRYDAVDGQETVRLDGGEGRYARLVIDGGRLVGGLLCGYTREVPHLHRLVETGTDIASLVPRLRAGDVSALAGSTAARPQLASSSEVDVEAGSARRPRAACAEPSANKTGIDSTRCARQTGSRWTTTPTPRNLGPKTLARLGADSRLGLPNFQ